MTIPAYPLAWPAGWRRTPGHDRAGGRFNAATSTTHKWSDGTMHVFRGKRSLTIAEAVQRVREQLDKMTGNDDFVVSTNLQLRLDGLPRSGQAEPQDPGAAVYWRDAGGTRCMAIDRYDRVADNLAAIAATLDAMRAIERHGGAEILERAFTGFTALPAPGAQREWWEVLGVARNATREVALAAYRRLASEHHPDRGGDPARMTEINRAWMQAREVTA